MTTGIDKRKIAVLATDGVEQVELTAPVRALRQAGAEMGTLFGEARPRRAA
jgi:protease I